MVIGIYQILWSRSPKEIDLQIMLATMELHTVWERPHACQNGYKSPVAYHAATWTIDTDIIATPPCLVDIISLDLFGTSGDATRKMLDLQTSD